ncbi:MAG: ECF transporter S component [Actinobacteria bacterium]|nr:ECF transporter S component [Actinomycetota bacterium]
MKESRESRVDGNVPGRGSTFGQWVPRALRRLLTACMFAFIFLGIRGVAPFSRWSLNSLFLALVLLVILFLRFEEREYGAREVAAVGALAAVGAAGRVFFAALPGVQPATFLAVLTGYAMGAETGFLAGALIALLSNIFLGHGPWTPWQMLAWGLAGASGGLLGAFRRPKSLLAAAAILVTSWGFIFGWLMNLWFWLSFVYPLNWTSYIATCSTSFWFDLFHAAGNLVFVLALWRPMAEMLRRYRERFRFRYLGEGREWASSGGDRQAREVV